MSIKFLRIDNQQIRRVYKYYSNIDYACDCITKKCIHFERFKDYNDIFDGCFELTSNNLQLMANNEGWSYKHFKKMLLEQNLIEVLNIVKLHDDEYFKLKNLKEIVDLTENFIGNNNYELAERIADYENSIAMKEDSANILCSCFSEDNKSIPMWSYYADNHRGCCIEFDLTTKKALSDERIKCLTKVNYTKNYLDDNIKNAFFSKSLEWSHEQEWRFIIDTDSQTEEYFLSFPYISAIYMGVRCELGNKIKLKDVARQNDIDIYQMKKVNSCFAIEPMLIK